MKNRLRSFLYAIRGIRWMLRSEWNMRIHILMAVLVIICGFLCAISLTEWLICLLCIGLVLALETINTAVETIVDMVSPEWQKLAAKAKDVAAGAVLIAAVFAAICGLIIFIPKADILINVFF